MQLVEEDRALFHQQQSALTARVLAIEAEAEATAEAEADTDHKTVGLKVSPFYTRSLGRQQLMQSERCVCPCRRNRTRGCRWIRRWWPGVISSNR